MSFKQFSWYHMQSPLLLSGDALEEALSSDKAYSPHATQTRSIGWVSPLGSDEPLAISLQDYTWLKVRIDTRLLPASVVTEAVKEKLQEREAEQGFPVSGKQKRVLKEETTLELLPKAFIQSKFINVVISPKDELLLVDNTSNATKDLVIDLLRQTFGSMPLTHCHDQKNETAQVLKAWTQEQSLPHSLVVDTDCTLVHPDNMQAKVRIIQHELGSPLIQSHLDSGMLVTQLALKFENEWAFVINDCLDVSRIKMLDIESDSQTEEDPKLQIMTDFSLKVPKCFALINQFKTWFAITETQEAAHAE
ncbi:recombination-associated protein RdgC [Candidatus Comchoanobacter bicostacola]|uniref:Recombination-associated protein RdgC n=1 Tax=Candidatus Comchoanobacter bicostacola TaxID=2919598 RepID=A0ABY5DIA7_9GAMM|nr:recombination-associated protein RdgC [Candidatus Comchoanobacter bicostacola]UTC24348.1 recombination-associated protein RdgC [Candidatus Comchoanobacter bicostacola]